MTTPTYIVSGYVGVRFTHRQPPRSIYLVATMVHDEIFSTAQEFLDALDLSQWVSGKAWVSSWVFRGQRRSTWALTPPSWRSGESPSLQRLKGLKEHYRNSYSETITEAIARGDSRFTNANVPNIIEAYSQGRAEFALIREFLELADQVGHPVPGMDQYKHLPDDAYLSNLYTYPNVDFLPHPNGITALAQHHGIPTRCLDWTKSAVVAAFFAAQDVASAEFGGSIAVWAIRPDLLLRLGGADEYNIDGFSRFMAVDFPYEQNKYLHAQQGLFLYPTYGCSYFALQGRWPELESFALSITEKANEPVIRKLTLPNSEVGELLRLLWLQGISKAHLMPTYDNVTQALLAKWRWLNSETKGMSEAHPT